MERCKNGNDNDFSEQSILDKKEFLDERMSFSLGVPAVISSSMPHSFEPRLIRNRPFSPHSVFQELATNQ
uniref:Uncharacterized protein n=1 Tax=Romanomermis culicivorax TaxID=13658 RepID=A0A915KVN6_ROMCU